MTVSLLNAHVAFKNMVISRCVLWSTAEKCTCGTNIFPFLTNNILALWRCRSRSRSRSRSRRLCLNSQMRVKYGAEQSLSEMKLGLTQTKNEKFLRNDHGYSNENTTK